MGGFGLKGRRVALLNQSLYSLSAVANVLYMLYTEDKEAHVDTILYTVISVRTAESPNV